MLQIIIFEKDKMTSGSLQYDFIVRLLMWCSSFFQVIFTPNNPQSFYDLKHQTDLGLINKYLIWFSLSDIFLNFDAFAPKTVDILNQSIWKIEFIIIRLYCTRKMGPGDFTNTNFEKIWWSVFRAEQILPRTEMRSVENFEIFLNGTYRIIFRLMDFHLTLDYFTRTL